MLFSSWLRTWKGSLERRAALKQTRRRRPPLAGKLSVEWLEDRLAPATLTVNTTDDDPTVTNTSALTLRDAIALVNSGGNPASLGLSSLPTAWAAQINTTNPFGTNDTIDFNIPTTDPGYAAPTSVGITHVSLSNDVATLTTSEQVPVAVGQTVIVAGLSNTLFNGNYQVTAETPTSFSYSLVHADVASTSASGTASDAGQFAISLSACLPSINNPVVINGFSQPGSSANTLPNQGSGAGDNAVPLITLDGSQLGGTYVVETQAAIPTAAPVGLTLAGANSTVTGLAIQNFNATYILPLGDNTESIQGTGVGIDVISSGNTIAGNDLSNDDTDILIDNVANNLIGGTNPAARNLCGSGLTIQGADATGNVLEGNYIGTNGTEVTGAVGILVLFASSNIIGGTAPGAGNVIAGNLRGIQIAGDDSDGGDASADNNLVQGNYIGLNPAGTAAFPGLGGSGIEVGNYEGYNNNIIGGTTAAARNVIAGWSIADVHENYVEGSGGGVVEGNYIGTNAAGTAAAGPSVAEGGFWFGIVAGAGGNSAIMDNLISGNIGAGILMGGTGNQVQGNLIGTDATGTEPIPNGVGIDVSSQNAQIGGNSPGEGNLIAFNDGPGIDDSGTGDAIVGNSIHGNTGPGVEAQGTGTQIEANSIYSNTGPGVWVQSDPFGAADPNGAFNDGLATGNSIQGNSIYGNGGLGITLGTSAVDVNGNPLTLQQVQANPALWYQDEPNNTVILNDSLGHVGANNYQNFPVLSSASSSSTDTSINGTFNEADEPNTTITLDFYANAAAAPSGYGQGQTWLGSITVTTDANGNAGFTANLATGKLGNLAGQWITATATDPNGNTSEFSADVQATVIPTILILDPKASGALSLSGNASIKLPTGDVVVDSNSKTALTESGNAQITAASIQVVGGVSTSGNAKLSPAAVTGVAPVANPLAYLTGSSPTGLTNYGAVNYSNGKHTLNPGIYSTIQASGNATLVLNPGVYLIEGGGMTVTGNASLSGTGVTIYNTSSNYPNNTGSYGGITLSGNGTFALTAPTSGAYAGILIFQPYANTRAISLSGNAADGIGGTIYAPAALLSVSGNASLNGSLVVNELSLSGNAASTQTADGSDADNAGSTAGQLLAGNVEVYVDNSNGDLTPDELARIQDAVNAVDAVTTPYGVTVAEVSDPTQANVKLSMGTASAAGGYAQGVLGCYTTTGQITLIQGWNWYAGADPSQIGADQYDFETTVTHELGHALGLGHSSDSTSVMYGSLAPATAKRTLTTADLNIPDSDSSADALHAAAPQITRIATVGTGDSAASGSATSTASIGSPLSSTDQIFAGFAGILSAAWNTYQSELSSMSALQQTFDALAWQSLNALQSMEAGAMGMSKEVRMSDLLFADKSSLTIV